MARGNSQKADAQTNGSGSATVITQVSPEIDKSLESWIWAAACSIRGAQDAPKYKEFILPLIFAKRLCDVFDDELNRIAKEVGSRAKAFKLVKHDKKLVRFAQPRLIPQIPTLRLEVSPDRRAIRFVSDLSAGKSQPYLRPLPACAGRSELQTEAVEDDPPQFWLVEQFVTRCVFRVAAVECRRSHPGRVHVALALHDAQEILPRVVTDNIEFPPWRRMTADKTLFFLGEFNLYGSPDPMAPIQRISLTSCSKVSKCLLRPKVLK
jgi:hypothetical protein